MSYTARQLLLALSLYFDGDYEKMLDEISNRRHSLSREQIEEYSLTKMNSLYTTIVDDDYPSCFKMITKPPLILYYYGNLSLLSQKYKVSCVGSRKPTIYQSETCYRLVSEMEEKMNYETVVISGMARGLDQCFMKAAMDKNAPVISIIGSGIDNPYPSENQGLYDYCKTNKGLVLSEYPFAMKAKPENFLFRNRLLAGGSEILFVGGAKKQSGTARSVSYALEFGKSILALPCNVTGDDLTNTIIKDGATPILNSDDFVNEIKELSR